MTVEELLELKRKADAIAEIEKTVAKETNRFSLLLDNLKQIVKFIKDTLVNTEISSAQFYLEVDDRSYTFVGFHKNGEFYIKCPGNAEKEVNEDNLEDDVTYKDGASRCIRPYFVQLADNWVRIKEEFLQDIKESLSCKIKSSQKSIASKTEGYITAKEFRL